MPARRWRLQTRIAGLVTTGALVVLGPVSVAFADPGSSGHASAAAAHGVHHPQQAKKKPASGKPERRSNKAVSRRTSHTLKKSAHKPAKKSAGKRKAHFRKSNKHSNAPAIFKKHTSAPPRRHAGKSAKKAAQKGHTQKQSPQVKHTGRASSSNSTRTTQLLASSTPARRPSSISAPPISATPQPQPAPVAAALVQPRASAGAAAPAPATTGPVRSAAAAPHGSRTRAASTEAQSTSPGAGTSRKPHVQEAMGPARVLRVLGADAVELIGIIAGVGFAIAVGAIVTGYRGARHL